MSNKIKYFNPNEVKKNSRTGVNIGGKVGYTVDNIRKAMCECNLIFFEINKKSA